MSIRRIHRAALYGSAAGAALLALAAPVSAFAQSATYTFDIPPQDVGSALIAYGRTARQQLVFDGAAVRDRQSPGLSGDYSAQDGLQKLLDGTGLRAEFAGSGAVRIVQGEGGSGPQSAGAGGDVDALIVTAQKREENIQDVPIAISAFSQEDLTRSQVAGGPDLMTQVPNMTFTKTNFSSYSIQIRGIGTQAISATVDPAVAVAFNNTPFVRNRFFEQEFYDLQRVEVLRGPQGTLYGRNATAGVVNIISAKPSFRYEARLSADVANYKSSRLEGMVNIPLVEDAVALRLAAAWTKRDGFVENQITGNPIDGRDLWSTRLSLRFEPTDGISGELIWEHFQEDDDRLRSGKQLCKTHAVTRVAGFDVMYPPSDFEGFDGPQGNFSQGCIGASLYSPDSFQTPNGTSLPYYLPLGAVFLPTALQDPYVSRFQSTDLRVIESTVDPQYKAESDLAEIQLSFDIGEGLTLASETSYSADTVFSLQDFNRFNTAPGAWSQAQFDNYGPDQGREGVLVDGVFCDPQIGCSDRLVAVDLSTAKSSQFSQEFRLSSDYDGAFNFSLGANFLRYDTIDKYYVFINSLSMISAISPYNRQGPLSPYVPGVTDNSECLVDGMRPGNPGSVYPLVVCTYIDPNPIGSLNDEGHNYFLSKNPYKLVSYAVFGETYYNITDNLKITGGLRWTVDRKEAPRIPSWVLAGQSVGYPVAEIIKQEWRKPTGRLTVDWKPDLSFTDDTLLYASFAHGYKAGGANPPNYTYVFYAYDEVTQAGSDQSATRPKTFKPEYVNAFELGAKSTFADGRVTLNLAAFYYDYTGYQISEIVDRSAFNRNFDAEVWGLEVEADWRPLENLRLGFKGGYENTKLADGSKAIDLMDRTAGDPNWVVVKPFPTFASNCILPTWLFVGEYDLQDGNGPYATLAPLGHKYGGNPGGCELAYIIGHDPVTDAPYRDLRGVDPSTIVLGGLNQYAYRPNYPGWDPATAPNHGEGIFKDISGNELPNAPNFTATVTADYTIPMGDWLATLHTDLYYQSEAWTRVFNTDGYDKLKAYNNINVAAIFTNDEAGWRVMAYVKNVLDRDSITGAFLNSDDTGLTTNVFLTEPRLYGIRVTKDWTGGSLLGSFGQRHEGPYRFTLELGGQVQQIEAPYEAVEPSFGPLFPSTIYDPQAVQNKDLDWGDGRDVKLTYRFGDGPWSLAAGARFGRTNGGDAKQFDEEEIPSVCMFGPPMDAQCALDEKYYASDTNWASVSATNREEYKLVDFTIGREVGFGSLRRSSITAGVRFAQFKSVTNLHVDGVPDTYIPEGFFTDKYLAGTHHRYRAELEALRKFEGAGPAIAWEASLPLLGGEEMGHVGLDWSVGAGVLFGRQTSTVSGTEDASYYQLYGLGIVGGTAPPTSTAPTTRLRIERSDQVTVPTFGASLGLSYQLDRMNLGAGYRWERYLDAVDGGFSQSRTFDRTVDGPYFKVSIGFGG